MHSARVQNLRQKKNLSSRLLKKIEGVVYEPLPGQGDARILNIGGKEYTE